MGVSGRSVPTHLVPLSLQTAFVSDWSTRCCDAHTVFEPFYFQTIVEYKPSMDDVIAIGYDFEKLPAAAMAGSSTD